MIQAVLLLLVGLLSVVYLYFHYTYKYWIKKGIPQEPPIFLVGNFLDLVRNKKNTGWIYNELYFKYKNNDAVGIYEFQTPKLLVRTPELFEAVLIKDFSSFYDNELRANLKLDPFLELNSFLSKGDKWKPARMSLINGLTKSKLKDMYKLMKQTIPMLMSYVEDNLGKDIQAKDVACLFMMTNISNVVYGIESNCFTDSDAVFHKIVSHVQDYWQSWWKTIITFNMQRLRDFLGFSFLPKKGNDFIESVLRQVIDAKMKNNIQRKDFMHHYLNLDKPLEDKIREIINHGMTFFFGGFETISLPPANLMYELALNPDIQENLYQELKMAYEGKSELDYDTLMSLPLLDRAFKEILRKYPTMYVSTRLCTNPTTLVIDGNPVKIEKGTPVVVPVHAVQHDPQYYPEPEVFDPERFSEEALQSRHPCTWLPFGAGPRACSGINFGLLLPKLFMASILYNYKIERTDKTPLKISFKKSSFFIVPEESQWIQLVKRK